MEKQNYWNSIYESKSSNQYSWTEDVPKISLDFIHSFNLPKTARIIDIGGGESKLADCLLNEGYENITVLDISETAIDKVKKRLGDKAHKIKWIVSDITEFKPNTFFDVWHDRATFHFLTRKSDIKKYIDTAVNSVTRYLTIGTFSDTGPHLCSGLQVKNYNEIKLSTEFKNEFNKIRCVNENHFTPFGTVQNFLFCSFRKSGIKINAAYK